MVSPDIIDLQISISTLIVLWFLNTDLPLWYVYRYGEQIVTLFETGRSSRCLSND